MKYTGKVFVHLTCIPADLQEMSVSLPMYWNNSYTAKILLQLPRSSQGNGECQRVKINCCIKEYLRIISSIDI